MGMAITGKATVVRAPNRVRCQELWAVLDAVGISAEIEQRGRSFFLLVGEHELERALYELQDYLQEDTRRPAAAGLDPLAGGWIGVLGYGAVLVAVAGLVRGQVFGADWFGVGRAQAGLILHGEGWRTVTALTLHVDARHLLGNLFFGAVLGFLAVQGLGGGLAWLALLIGGALGNLANAMLHAPQHSAVGASTAVFAALGVLVALALQQRRASAEGLVRRWSPLVAGVLLLAWTGIGGERTDVQAHVTGLLAGLAVGAVCGLIPRRLLELRAVQLCATLITLAILIGAWGLALR